MLDNIASDSCSDSSGELDYSSDDSSGTDSDSNDESSDDDSCADKFCSILDRVGKDSVGKQKNNGSNDRLTALNILSLDNVSNNQQDIAVQTRNHAKMFINMDLSDDDMTNNNNDLFTAKQVVEESNVDSNDYDIGPKLDFENDEVLKRINIVGDSSDDSDDSMGDDKNE